MKKIILMVAVAFVCSAAGPVRAEDAFKIGYVNMRLALNECKAGKAAKEVLEKIIKDMQAQLDEEEKQLKTMQEDLEKKASLLSERAKSEKQKEFQEKVQAYQKKRADAQKDINAKEADLTKKIIDDVRTIIEKIGKEENYHLIFEETEISVLYSKAGLDLTDRVIRELDAVTK